MTPISLTRKDGAEVFVNIEQIVSFSRYDAEGCVEIQLAGGGHLAVRNSISEILEEIEHENS